MFTFLYALVFNLLIFPVLFIFYHLIAIFNNKYRRGVIGRYRSFGKAAEFLKTIDQSNHEIYLIHCSSMGEFEHIKPFVRELKHRLPQCKIVVMFFSPSGYENVKSAPGVDLFIYAPFDGWFIVRKLFKLLHPRALIIAKYDVWPNQVWTAEFMGIPRFLVNATLYSASGRLRPGIRWFQRAIYRKISLILTISEKDKENYRMLSSPEKIVVVGDTKYDQVVFRSEESRKKMVLPGNIRSGKRIWVAGSTWPEDEEQLIPALRNLMNCFQEQLLTIICPHEPTAEHLEELAEMLQPLKSCLYSRLDEYKGEPIIIIDRIGLLANLYSVAQAAYVGGSFRQNVHNVLEPAVYGIPVMFGPVNQNSHEAQLLKQKGGGIEVHSAKEIESELRRVFENENYRSEVSKAAKQLVEENRGATRRTVDSILDYLETQN
jgi:3-deoxy-D-manno-octulosonic-acid transferase